MSRQLPAAVREVGHALVTTAGGYLRNTIYEPYVTCSVCATPVDGYDLCYQCLMHARSGLGIADRVATIVYAQESSASGQRDQTYLAMFGYKANRPQQSHVAVVRSLAALGVRGHATCDLTLAGDPPEFRWVTVPSTRNPERVHPLHELVSGLFVPGYELPVRSAPGAAKTRGLQPENCEISDAIPPGTHVLVIEDSWVTGGSAQSTAIAVREAGAQSVSILAIARVLKPDFHTTADFLRAGRLTSDFDPTICPWTGATCP